MIRTLFFYLLLLISSSLLAQSTQLVKGTLVDENQQPVESATVFFAHAKDSTLIDYARSNARGEFVFKIKKQAAAVFFKASRIGYSDFSKSFKNISEDIDFAVIQMQSLPTHLEELVIAATTPPIRVKKDTLEFNASSFKVRPDANVEALLKQLPGVEIDSDKKITVNGRAVDQILVNGKPFFDQDGKMALQNLPAEIINKIQVSDTKSKKEEFTAKKSTSEKSSINFTIDEDKNTGFFGKFMGGYGTDDRYESSGIANYFKGEQKISVIGSSNNINASGFSMDEVFDNMRGGRSGSMRGSAPSRASGGITQSNTIGVNYNDEFWQRLNTSASYNLNTSDVQTSNRSTRTNLLPSGVFSTFSDSKSEQHAENHLGSFAIEYEIDSTSNLYYTPNFNQAYSNNISSSKERALDEAGQLLNQSQSQQQTSTQASNLGNQLRYSKRMKREGQYFTASIHAQNSKNNSRSQLESETQFFQDDTAIDLRNQLGLQRSNSDNFELEVEYSQPITDSLAVELALGYRRDKSLDDSKIYDFDPVEQLYTRLNDQQSNVFSSDVRVWVPRTSIRISKSKLNITIAPGLAIATLDARAAYLGEDLSLTKNYINPDVSAYASYQFTKAMNLMGSYTYHVDYQSAAQMLPIIDVSSPLNTKVGNPDLSPTAVHAVFLNWGNYNFSTRSGLNVYVSAQLFDNQSATSVTYDENKKATTTYKDISGSYNYAMGTSWSKTYQIEEHKLRYGLNLRYSYSSSQGYADDAQYTALASSWAPRAYLTWDYKEWLTLMPSYNFSTNTTKYENFSVDQAQSFQHSFGLQTTSYWPENWAFGNDFAYTYNSKIAAGFQRGFYLWNSSLSYSFLDKRWMAKVKVYDLLNQNTSASRTIDPSYILDQESLVLKRYFMFSLTYKLDRFAGARSAGNSSREYRGASSRRGSRRL